MRAGRRSRSRASALCTVRATGARQASTGVRTGDSSRDPLLVERAGGGGGLRLAATFATLGANGLHIHQLAPQSRAQMGELRTAWARAARVDADASMSRGTAIRTARRAAEATAEEEEAAEEEAAAEEEELLLGFI